jgi:hypothetical protein
VGLTIVIQATAASGTVARLLLGYYDVTFHNGSVVGGLVTSRADWKSLCSFRDLRNAVDLPSRQLGYDTAELEVERYVTISYVTRMGDPGSVSLFVDPIQGSRPVDSTDAVGRVDADGYVVLSELTEINVTRWMSDASQ